MASFINRRSITVEWRQCDPAGFVFNSRFFEIFDQSTWELFEVALGVQRHEIARTFGILGFPLVDVKANFIHPVTFGKNIEVSSRVSDFRRSSFDVEHKIRLNGEVAAECVETRVWAAHGDGGKMGAIPVPPEVVARFEAT